MITAITTTLVIRLSTGYEVVIDNDDPESDVVHLGRAILGEVFLPVASRKGFESAMKGVSREIENIIDQLSASDRDSLLTLHLFHSFFCAYDWARRHAKARKKIKRAKTSSQP